MRMLVRAARRLSIPFLTRYAAVGTVAAIIYVGLYCSLVELAGMASLAASILAFSAAIAVQYAAHARFTFRRPAADFRQGARFFLATLAGMAVSSVISILGPINGWPPLLTAVVVVVAAPALNLVLLTGWVFARQADKQPNG